MTRRGVVWIAPVDDVPSGRMTNPATSAFRTSWQDDGVLDDAEILGADAAITWGRERANTVLIRLGHTEPTYFSAGDQVAGAMASWPPQGPPVDG